MHDGPTQRVISARHKCLGVNGYDCMSSACECNRMHDSSCSYGHWCDEVEQARGEQAVCDCSFYEIHELTTDYAEVEADRNRLVREMDVAINGEDGAAPQASLCDMVSQIGAMARAGVLVGMPAERVPRTLARKLGSIISGIRGLGFNVAGQQNAIASLGQRIKDPEVQTWLEQVWKMGREAPRR